MLFGIALWDLEAWQACIAGLLSMNSLARTHPFPAPNASVHDLHRLDKSHKLDQGMRTLPLSAGRVMNSNCDIPRMTCYHDVNILWHEGTGNDICVVPCMTCTTVKQPCTTTSWMLQ